MAVLSVEREVQRLEADLNSFDGAVRAAALDALVDLANAGKIALEPESEVANMHCHTFFSFNSFGYSPTALAWLARRRGYKLMGIVDFDVLDGVDEFLNACERVAIRGSAGLETRVYIPAFAMHEINSVGEPGVYYSMGIGFTSAAVPHAARLALDDMHDRAAQRNRRMVTTLNDYLSPVRIDYERDVLPQTPQGNATERHIVTAYIRAVQQQVAQPVDFWAGTLGITPAQITASLADSAGFQNLARVRLMKRGGPGYTAPGPATFPDLEEFHAFVERCGALPCATWLDGLSSGEQAIEALMALLIDKGVCALNIIPDRNWNIADPDLRRQKIENLYRVVDLAQRLDLPINVGTEMNSFGQKLVDDFDAPELARARQVFLEGAYFIYGHTAAERALGRGYQSEWAKSHLKTRRERNLFYVRLGRLVPPGRHGLNRLQQVAAATPEELLDALTDAGTGSL